MGPPLFPPFLGSVLCCMSEMASPEWGKMAPRMKEAVCIHTTTEKRNSGAEIPVFLGHTTLGLRTKPKFKCLVTDRGGTS